LIKVKRLFVFAILLLITCFGFTYTINLFPTAHADCTYCLSAIPSLTTEGNSVNLFLNVNGATPNTLYSFIFNVKDPALVTYQSAPQNYTTGSGQDRFTIQIAFPFSGQPSPGSTNLVGQYVVSVDQIAPVAISTIANTNFNIILTDAGSYQRTQIVNIQGSGYTIGESVNVTIKAQTSGTTVYSQSIIATATGMILANWKIPVNAITDTYIVTLTGVVTNKNPPDLSHFTVTIAIMNIQSITSSKSLYVRTETMRFSFQAKYPDGTLATTGSGQLVLKDPTTTGTGTSLTTSFDTVAQTFNASYKSLPTDATGSWTIALNAFAYSDAYGNLGNWFTLTSNVQLTIAPLNVDVIVNTNFATSQQSKFNITITYPDGSILSSGSVNAYLTYTGTPTINDTIPIVYDTGLKLWVGTYTPKSSDTGGLWSLTIKASDSSTVPNTGLATRAINLQNTNGQSSLPLYYYGIIGLLIGLILAFLVVIKRRRGVTNTRLRLDLDAVRSEAGRIESQDFFKSVKGQVNQQKNNDDNSK
jgi:hypothetical protein